MPIIFRVKCRRNRNEGKSFVFPKTRIYRFRRAVCCLVFARVCCEITSAPKMILLETIKTQYNVSALESNWVNNFSQMFSFFLFASSFSFLFIFDPFVLFLQLFRFFVSFCLLTFSFCVFAFISNNFFLLLFRLPSFVVCVIPMGKSSQTLWIFVWFHF